MNFDKATTLRKAKNCAYLLLAMSFVAGYGLRVTGYGLRVAGYGLKHVTRNSQLVL